MRTVQNREQRWQWVQSLVGASYDEEPGRRAVAIETAWGLLGVEFAHIAEVLQAERMSSFAFLPPSCCGVVEYEGSLVPVVDVSACGGARMKVLVIEAKAGRFGIRYNGVPGMYNIDRDNVVAEGKRPDIDVPFPLSISECYSGNRGRLHMLDPEGTAENIAE